VGVGSGGLGFGGWGGGVWGWGWGGVWVCAWERERGGGVTYVVLLSKSYSLSKDGNFALREALRGLPHQSEENP